MIAHGLAFGQRGVGDIGALVDLPSYENCDSRDSACVARNNAKSAAYGLALEQAQAQNNYNQCMQNALNADSPAQYQESVARCNGQFTIQTPDISGATPISNWGAMNSNIGFSFITSSGSNIVHPGETWSIQISGGQPGSMVTVGVSGNQGSLDGNGKFVKTGTFSVNDIGVWNEAWKVNSVTVGNANFTVVPVGGVADQAQIQAEQAKAQADQANMAAQLAAAQAARDKAAADAAKEVVKTSTTLPPVSSTVGGSKKNTTNIGVFSLFGDTSNPITVPVIGSVGEYTALGIGVAALVVGFLMLKEK